MKHQGGVAIYCNVSMVVGYEAYLMKHRHSHEMSILDSAGKAGAENKGGPMSVAAYVKNRYSI